MKTIIFGLALTGLIGIVHAEESIGEKAKATANDAKALRGDYTTNNSALVSPLLATSG